MINGKFHVHRFQASKSCIYGCEVLSGSIPKTVVHMEKFMQERRK